MIHRNFARRALVALALVATTWVHASSPAPAAADRELGLQPPPTIAGVNGRIAAAPQPKSVAVANGAASWLVAQQTATGGFPWTPGDAGVFANTQGATALGLVRAHGRTAVAGQLAAAIANANCQVAGEACIAGSTFDGTRHRFATHDALFLQALAAASGNAAYADFVDQHLWSDLAAGAYGASANLDAAGYANLVLTTRSSQGIRELVPWDLSKLVLAAHGAGETAAR